MYSYSLNYVIYNMEISYIRSFQKPHTYPTTHSDLLKHSPFLHLSVWKVFPRYKQSDSNRHRYWFFHRNAYCKVL